MKEFAAHPKGKAVYDTMLDGIIGPRPENPSKEELEIREKQKAMFALFLNDMPLCKMVAMSQGQFTEEKLEETLKMVNQ